MIDLEDAFLHQAIEDGRGGTGFLQQFLLGHFLQLLATACPTGQLHVFHEQGQLLLGSGKLVEEGHHTCLIQVLAGQSDPGLGARFVIPFQIFLHEDGLLVEQALHYGEDVLHPYGALQLSDTLLLIGAEEIEQALFAIAERMGSLKLIVVHHHGLALQLHTRRHRGLVHIAQGAEIVCR